MKLIIDIPEYRYDEIHSLKFVMYGLQSEENRKLFYRLINAVQDGTLIPDNATNGDVIKAMFGDDKVSEFMCHIRIIPKEGNWFNEGVVAEFNNVWWNAPYQKGGKE